MIMIDAVILNLSRELYDALGTHNPVDKALVDAYESCLLTDAGTKISLHVEPQMAEDWCESWFDPEDLAFFLEKNSVLDVEYPAFCDDPLVKDFVQTVLKIYRLTVSM